MAATEEPEVLVVVDDSSMPTCGVFVVGARFGVAGAMKAGVAKSIVAAPARTPEIFDIAILFTWRMKKSKRIVQESQKLQQLPS